jgi:carboxypeptidase PM20D1
MKKILGVLALAPVLLAAFLLANTLRVGSLQVDVEPAEEIPVDSDRLATQLSRAIQFRTVAHREPEAVPRSEFFALHRYLEAIFPRTHRALRREVVEDLSLLFTWEGFDNAAPPILLMGHLDVVPVEPETEARWTYPPFSGRVADGFVWGRGALDIKGPVLGILTAVERLLIEGYEPGRTVYIALGHNEEVAGNGAQAIADLLRSRNVELLYVLDEGLALTEGVIPGVSSPAALVGIAEKGAVSLMLTVATEGGHSAMPPPHSAAGILAGAVSKLESRPFPASLQGPARLMFETLAPEMSFPMRALFSNLWLFGPLVESRLAAVVSTNAAIRTTTAVTVLESGIRENVLPKRASAIVNYRILPGETVEGVIERVRSTVGDPRIQIEALPGGRDPSPVSRIDSESYSLLARTIREVFPDAVVAPGLVIGGTDSRHFTDLCESVYRFVPIRVGPDDLGRIHGVDERVSLVNQAEFVRFYDRLIRNTVERPGRKP